ncbi:hypothetical protein [Paenibacillus sp. FSL E2-0178]|uniref:hypothetical protein n=1 Tax=Paenibacillus sp. FSL E2-0178 TaxID=2921361 RepID=UPI0031588432
MTILAGMAVFTGNDKGYVFIAADSKKIVEDVIIDNNGDIVSRHNKVVIENDIKVHNIENMILIGTAGSLISRYGEDDLLDVIVDFISSTLKTDKDLISISNKVFDFIADNMAKDSHCDVILGGFINNQPSLTTFKVISGKLEKELKVLTSNHKNCYSLLTHGIEGQIKIQFENEIARMEPTNQNGIIKSVFHYIKESAKLSPETCNQIVRCTVLD